jgi:hypothetical protein
MRFKILVLFLIKIVILHGQENHVHNGDFEYSNGPVN